MDSRSGGLAIILSALLVMGCTRDRDRGRAASAPLAPGVATTHDLVATEPVTLQPHDFLLREHEFVDHTARLNVAGEDRLELLASGIADAEFPIIIEPSSNAPPGTTGTESGEPALDVQRREAVVQRLLSMGIADAHERVTIGDPAGVAQAVQASTQDPGRWGFLSRTTPPGRLSLNR